MHKSFFVIPIALVINSSEAWGCSCYLPPQTFCGTVNAVDHPFADPAWFAPHAIIVGVKLADVAHGVDMQVVQSFTGSLQNEEVIRVWGDCGNLCRRYTDGLAIGDTVVWAIQDCDGAGNNAFCGGGESLEQPEHYQLSACGVYWLHYANGLVSGPLTTAGITESLSLVQFADLVENCSYTMSVGDARAPEQPFFVWYANDAPVLELRSAGASIDLVVCDVRGCTVLSRKWDGAPLPITGLPPGAYTAHVASPTERRSCMLLIPH